MPTVRADKLAEPLVRVYEKTTDQLLLNIAKYFDGGDESLADLNWQLKQLGRMGQLKRENFEIILANVKGNRELVEEALNQAVESALAYVEPELAGAASAGALHNALPAKMSPRISELLKAYQAQAMNTLNLVNTTMLESSVRAFVNGVTKIHFDAQTALKAGQLVDFAAGQAILGTDTRARLVKETVAKLAKDGITGFVDSAGRKWSAEAFVNMNIRTTMHNTFREATFARNQDYGNDIVYAQAKNASRPGCYPWQNVLMSMSNQARTVFDLHGNAVKVIPASATSYGEPAGIWGVNCRHSCNIFVPGISIMRGEAPDEEDNERQYKADQEKKRIQRAKEKKRLDKKLEKQMDKRSGVNGRM